jgi:hypothetical protein
MNLCTIVSVNENETIQNSMIIPASYMFLKAGGRERKTGFEEEWDAAGKEKNGRRN